MNVLYFAYGSNMSTLRLAERVDATRAVGRARVAHHRLAFNKPGGDGTGKANLVSAPDEWAWGVAWILPELALADLDRFEPGYQRIAHPVELDGGVVRAAHVYLWTDPSPEIRPAAWYVAHLIEGATEHALPEAWLARLREIQGSGGRSDG